MITLDKNYIVETDNTHGFVLKYESDVKVTKDGKEFTSKDVWYYPKLSQVLEKFYSLNLSADSEKELLEKTIKIEQKINDFSKTFAKGGKILQL